MATFTNAPTFTKGYPRTTGQVASFGGGGVTTYYYRTPAGVRGSTTNVGSIPVGSVIERIVTS